MQAIGDAELIRIVRDHKSMCVTEADLVAELAGVSLVDGFHDLAATNSLCQRFEGKILKKKAAFWFNIGPALRKPGGA